MDEFNFSFSEGLRYSHSPASTPRLIEAPSDRVQSMHLMPTYHSIHDENDSKLRTLDLFNESSGEGELEPQLGVQRVNPCSERPLKSPDEPQSHHNRTEPAAHFSPSFHEALNSLSDSPASVYSSQQQPLPDHPVTTYEVTCHNSIRRPSTTSGICTSSPLRQVFSLETVSPVRPATSSLPATKAKYRCARVVHHPPRKDSLPSTFQNHQSFIRYSKEHALPPPTRKHISPPPPPIDISESQAHLPDTIFRA